MRDPGKDIIVSLAEANFWTLRTPESGEYDEEGHSQEHQAGLTAKEFRGPLEE